MTCAAVLSGITLRLSCAVVVLVACGVAEARPPYRGPSAAQIKAMNEQMAYMQLEMVRYQSEVAEIQQVLFKSFDQDGDGVLQGGEKARYAKHIHEIETGKAPSPFATIRPVGQGPKPKSSIAELQKRSEQYKSGVIAKQQEIFNSFDENGNGQLEGGEKAKFSKFMNDIQIGRAPNPFTPSHASKANGSGKK